MPKFSSIEDLKTEIVGRFVTAIQPGKYGGKSRRLGIVKTIKLATVENVPVDTGRVYSNTKFVIEVVDKSKPLFIRADITLDNGVDKFVVNSENMPFLPEGDLRYPEKEKKTQVPVKAGA